MNIHVLYNPMSNNGNGKLGLDAIKGFYPADIISALDVTKIDNIVELISDIPAEDMIILCGGDGTIHHFVNDYGDNPLEHDIYYYPSGTGNDFINDIGRTKEQGPFVLNEYLKKLPVLSVNGKSHRYLNNVGYGIDGYVCEVADLQRVTSKKKINYTAIALKGLLGGYHPANALIYVDGKRYDFENVWLAPTMKGRYCGGGMMLAPTQNRMDEERKVSCVVMHNASKLKALTRFSKVIKGEHLKYKDMVSVIEGHDIEVIFDTPCALQVDGETVLGVLRYSVHAE